MSNPESKAKMKIKCKHDWQQHGGLNSKGEFVPKWAKCKKCKAEKDYL